MFATLQNGGDLNTHPAQERSFDMRPDLLHADDMAALAENWQVDW